MITINKTVKMIVGELGCTVKKIS